MSRSHRTLMAALGIALLFAPADALAKGKKGKKGGKRGNPEIQLTGFKSFDKVLRQVDAIDERIDIAEFAMKTAKRDLNLALDLKKGTPLKDALGELKITGGDAVGVVMKGKLPELTVTDAAPKNVVDGVGAVNSLTRSLITSIDELANIPQEVEGLTAAVQSFPDQVKKEFAGDPIGAAFKAPKLVKSLKGNIEITSSLPKRSVDVSQRAANILTIVGTEFTPIGNNRPAADRGADRNDGARGGASRGGTRR